MTLTTYTVHFHPGDIVVQVPGGVTLSEAAQLAGLDLNQPCGGQGRCGRCAVIVDDPAARDASGPRSAVRRRSTIRLSPEAVAAGYALACQTVVEGDAWVTVPAQQAIERRLTTQKAAARVEAPFDYDPRRHQPIQRYYLRLDPPDLADQTDDWSRVTRALATHGVANPEVSLPLLRDMPRVLRALFSDGKDEAEPAEDQAPDISAAGAFRWHDTTEPWQVTAVVSLDAWDRPQGPPQLLALLPGDHTARNLGAAVDIGTTTITVWLVDLESGEVVAQASDYNGQIARGEDVISRIIYARKPARLIELQELVVGTINRLLQAACQKVGADPQEVFKVTVAGNPTMIHLFLAIPPESIRLEPFIPVVNYAPTVRAGELGLAVNPQAVVDCLPGVASYVGADISAGVLSARMDEAPELTLFIDVGTNGETVLGNADWLITCACSAGPAFEGAGVEHGMRATTGAIEEVWINHETLEPTYRVIGPPGEKPRGICGSGLLSLLAEMLVAGVVDKAGNLRKASASGKDGAPPRNREGQHGPEYVIAWGAETADGRDISITEVDIDNLMRAKAAIYAGFTVMAQSVGVDLADVSHMLIGGSFGQHINVEKAVQIGLLPDLPAPAHEAASEGGDASPWDRFKFLGNTAIRGAYMALLHRDVRAHLNDIARKMTYLELSANNTFYDAFMSAMFLPHTDLGQFPTVKAALKR
ncbi:MAG: DUF4445 domain-containing protein [Chloroflexi bacterium]|nr:DUF4445 domain-containing protein [Chloroflexota bacterium]